jgi:hypothetical protein
MNVEENEIQDLKDDLAAALKENAVLQAELQEAYRDKGLEYVDNDKPVFEQMKQELGLSHRTIGQLKTDLDNERKYYASSGADLMRALSILKNLHLNGKPSWRFFETKTGQDELSWASEKLNTQMSKFFKEYGG